MTNGILTLKLRKYLTTAVSLQGSTCSTLRGENFGDGYAAQRIPLVSRGKLQLLFF